MNKRFLLLAAAAGIMLPTVASADNVIVATDAYRWVGDSILQGEYKAWADSPF